MHFSKLVVMVRIENYESRTIFEKRNLLKSRATRGVASSLSQRLVFEETDSNEDGAAHPFPGIQATP